jgi:hypothetical protein
MLSLEVGLSDGSAVVLRGEARALCIRVENMVRDAHKAGCFIARARFLKAETQEEVANVAFYMKDLCKELAADIEGYGSWTPPKALQT